MLRVSQGNKVNFKHRKFIAALAFLYSFRQEILKNARIFEIGPRLNMPICVQSFTTLLSRFTYVANIYRCRKSNIVTNKTK